MDSKTSNAQPTNGFINNEGRCNMGTKDGCKMPSSGTYSGTKHGRSDLIPEGFIEKEVETQNGTEIKIGYKKHKKIVIKKASIRKAFFNDRNFDDEKVQCATFHLDANDIAPEDLEFIKGIDASIAEAAEANGKKACKLYDKHNHLVKMKLWAQ